MANPQDASVAITPFGTYQYSNAFFDFMKTWAPSLSNNNISPTDWRIWLPRAFYLNWSDPQIAQKSMMDPTIWFPVALNPNKEERDQAIQHIIQIINSGTIFSGNINNSSGVVVGQNIKTDDIKANLEQSINQNPNSEYFKGLKELTEKLEKEYENNSVPKEKQTEINQSILDLQNKLKILNQK